MAHGLWGLSESNDVCRVRRLIRVLFQFLLVSAGLLAQNLKLRFAQRTFDPWVLVLLLIYSTYGAHHWLTPIVLSKAPRAFSQGCRYFGSATSGRILRSTLSPEFQ
ncbi:hypothetical protein BV898_19190 [Hypsibius exemplaris]|uniref:Uncharacterized protein n=1 Tax=Hypsibius exemplaris TaxID=2072580 RepID=A0A9X6NL75_HYPEX|nr:hypothetical protein BV898_19190 [Hypsibius exemplaris]